MYSPQAIAHINAIPILAIKAVTANVMILFVVFTLNDFND